MRRNPRLAVAIAATLVAALAACGDDDDDSAAADTTAAAATTPTTGVAATTAAAADTTAAAPGAGGGGDETAVCDPYIDVSLAFNGEPDPAALVPMLDEIEAKAPAEIAAELGTMVDAGRKVMESQGQDFSAFETVEFAEAQGTVDPWMYEHCPFENKAEVTAADFSFEGIPSEVAAGGWAMLLTNEGTEAHELAVLRKAEGTTESWDELLALPEEEAEAKVEFAGGAFAGVSGSSGLLIADLTPGDYIAVCFVPAGTSMTAGGAVTEGTGVPHHVAGMRHEFTVA